MATGNAWAPRQDLTQGKKHKEKTAVMGVFHKREGTKGGRRLGAVKEGGRGRKTVV